MREQIRVTRPGGTVSAIACFCHSGGLPHYHGRYPLPGNHRIDELDRKLDRVWRVAVRPRLLGVDHSILNLDLAWQFKEAGLQDVHPTNKSKPGLCRLFQLFGCILHHLAESGVDVD